MSAELVSKRCAPCEGGVEPLSARQVRELLVALHGDWQLGDDGKHILRQFAFPTYGRTLAFANAAAWIAISEGHHPVLTIDYNHCTVSYTTHAIGGLSDNDFICAAKTDLLVDD